MVVPHGGPWARDDWGYNPLAQFFANRGYAVLMPNFRGSTGYGKKFLNARQRRVGPQDAGRRHLGREVPGGGRHRGSEARRHPGRIVWRLCNAGGGGVHAGCVSRRPWTLSGHRICLRCSDPFRRIGKRDARSCTRAWPIRGTPEGKALVEGTLAAEFGGEDQDAAAGGAGRERSAGEQARSGTDRDGAARPRASRWNICSRRTKATALRGR